MEKCLCRMCMKKKERKDCFLPRGSVLSDTNEYQATRHKMEIIAQESLFQELDSKSEQLGGDLVTLWGREGGSRELVGQSLHYMHYVGILL